MIKRDLNIINEFILHCSANGPGSNIGAREIRRYHTLPVAKGGRGWEDIGYHVVIRRDGTEEDGRPLEYQGAHCEGHNKTTIGICLVGGIDNSGRPQDNFTREQFDALAKLIRRLRLRWPKASIHGHNEYANKPCPVFNVAKFLERYGIVQDPGAPAWDAGRWPHFRPAEFEKSGCDGLWGSGPMPTVWKAVLDALERSRERYGHPLILDKAEWHPETPALMCDVRIPESARPSFIRLAMDAGFVSARSVSGGVRLYMENSEE